jgi:hypothetical protein
MQDTHDANSDGEEQPSSVLDDACDEVGAADEGTCVKGRPRGGTGGHGGV